MLVACITGPDFLSAKKQIKQAEALCDAIEIREDLIGEGASKLETELPVIDCREFPTYHNFDETPDDLDALVASMPKAPLIKIATMANCATDSLRMLDLVSRYSHVCGMCMGPHGQITRILAPIYGSPLTFASVGGPAAAEGQLWAHELLDRYRFRSLSPSTKVYGLIGNPVDQSPSHVTHNAYFAKHGLDAVYVKLCVKDAHLPLFFDLVKRLDFKGLSVTIPYKEQVMPFVDRVCAKAEHIGAINTISFEQETIGLNTDADGALDVLEKRGKVRGKSIVILGAGGSGKAIAYEAARRGGRVRICSRRYGNLDQISPYDILITTLPIPIDHDPIPGTIVFDIGFQRAQSPLMRKALLKGCKLIFGEEMFSAQAALQFATWGQIPS